MDLPLAMSPLSRSRLSLRQLEAFCAVAQLGGVSAAAQRMSRTQSAVSTALSELELGLGARLFDRVGRRLQPTEAARRLLPKALELIERAAELPALAADPGELAERLALGASRTIGPFVMPTVLEPFLAARPKLTVELVVANTQRLVTQVLGFELDLALVEGSVNESDLSIERWLTDELCLFARRGHPRLQAPRAAPSTGRASTVPGTVPVSAATLREARWALREPGSGTRETFLRALAPLIGAPRVGLEISDPQTLKQFVAGGEWFGCLSRRAVAEELAAGELVELRSPEPAVHRDLIRHFWILSHPQRYPTDTLTALRRHLTQFTGH